MADNSYHDNNHTPNLIAVSSADGKTPVNVYADPTTHRLLTTPSTTSGSATAQTSTNANVVTATVGAADGTFTLSSTVICTAYTSGNLNIQVAYTDETNTSRTATIQGHFTSGYGINVSGVGAFEGGVIAFRAKAGTNVVVSTIGTFTLTYDIFASLMQIA